jgi:hypothetical protein
MLRPDARSLRARQVPGAPEALIVDEPEGLSAIGWPGTALVLWRRQVPSDLAALLDALPFDELPHLRFEAIAADRVGEVLAAALGPRASKLAPLLADVADLARLFAGGPAARRSGSGSRRSATTPAGASTPTRSARAFSAPIAGLRPSGSPRATSGWPPTDTWPTPSQGRSEGSSVSSSACSRARFRPAPVSTVRRRFPGPAAIACSWWSTKVGRRPAATVEIQGEKRPCRSFPRCSDR